MLKQNADGRGDFNLSLKQDGRSSLELSRQIRQIVCEVLYIIIIKLNHIMQLGHAPTCVCCGVVVHAQALLWPGLIKAYFLLCSNPWVSHTGCLCWLSGRGDSCPSSSHPKQQWGGAQGSSLPSTGIQQIPEVSSPTIPEAAAATAAGNRCDTPTPLPLDPHQTVVFAWFSTPSAPTVFGLVGDKQGFYPGRLQYFWSQM